MIGGEVRTIYLPDLRPSAACWKRRLTRDPYLVSCAALGATYMELSMREIVCAVAILGGAFLIPARAQAKNWDRDAIQTEQGRIRSEYLSKAGMLPSYKTNSNTGMSEPTGESYKGNCCGEADAYESDDMFIDADGATWAVLTCNEPENCKEVLGTQSCGTDEESGVTVCIQVGAKVMRPPGSRWRVPPDKVLLNYDPTNNTGHGWVYISPNATDGEGAAAVICWAAPPGS